jgi:hypothetical protein
MYKPSGDISPQRLERLLENLVRLTIEELPLYKDSLYRLGGEMVVQMYTAQSKMKNKRKKGEKLSNHRNKKNHLRKWISINYLRKNVIKTFKEVQKTKVETKESLEKNT